MVKKFKIRASQIAKIMTNPRKKTETLSETTKTYLKEWLKEQIYNRKKEFTSKYTDKGNIVEDNSIDFAAEMLGYGMLVKNEEYFENDFITGTPDVITNDTIIDLKNSWDNFTFPLFDDEIPNKDYMHQLQGYMALKGLKKARLIYVLSDTPLNLIEKEAFHYCRNNGYDELDSEILKQFVDKMTYSDIDNSLKIKVFDLEYDAELIESINQRVKDCRVYLENLIKMTKVIK